MSTSKIALVIHGGATVDSDFIRKNNDAYKVSLAEAAQQAYTLLENGGSAVDAVEAAVNYMENNELFNAGRGSALNAEGHVEMCSSIMDGKGRNSGAVAVIKRATNPVSVARRVMEDTQSMFLAGQGAVEFAAYKKLPMQEEDYFVTPHQTEAYEKKRSKMSQKEIDELRNHGTVGAVALDQEGNVAAATSTGGIEMNRVGRVGDSALVGAGCFADNNTCAVSGTGDGEYLIRSVAAGYVSMLLEHTSFSLQEACDYVIHTKNAGIDGDMGLIAVNAAGKIGIAFNSEVMHRAWISTDQPLQVHIYPTDSQGKK